MSTSVVIDELQLVPVREASTLVPYTRDHITRLAREGKVVAVRLDRQWMIDAASLVSFYTSAAQEDEVRRQRLSEARRREIEVAEFHRAALDQIDVRQREESLSSTWQTIGIVVCGLCAGIIFYSSSQFFDPATSSVAQVPVATGSSVPTVLQTDEVTVQPAGATATSRPLSLENGIVLLPAEAASSTEQDILELFSDEVEIEMVSETRGIVRAPQLGEQATLSVVRVPNTVEDEVHSTTQ